MASRPPVTCRICHEALNPDEDLVSHLIESHSKEELATTVAAREEEINSGEVEE